ncbi:unnamed protein product [Phytomonas sp. Hart1]|nr:unnamed protein product [Phytomonas sp. Hart1]|eukprot:CCW66048.1 unnamed protein product [Phytomonas sp. isolate Hart1]
MSPSTCQTSRHIFSSFFLVRHPHSLLLGPRLGVFYTSQRSYYWPYSADLVPKDANTSSFHSSSLPSVRERVIEEYALGPLFGASTPLCTLGFAKSARDVIEVKRELRDRLAELLSFEAHQLRLGSLIQTKEMLLYRADTPESPPLADGTGSGFDEAHRRRTRYARLPIQARTLLDVYLLDEEADEEERRQLGSFVQESLLLSLTRDILRGGYERNALSNKEELTLLKNVRIASDESSNEIDSVIVRLIALGVVYCKLPYEGQEDAKDYTFDELHGKAVGENKIKQVMERWERRLA